MFTECCYFYKSKNYGDILLLLSLAPDDDLLEDTALNELIANNETTLTTMFDVDHVFKVTGQLR